MHTHSLVLEQASWMQVVHEVLLPVLDDVRDCASLNRAPSRASFQVDTPVEKVYAYVSIR